MLSKDGMGTVNLPLSYGREVIHFELPDKRLLYAIKPKDSAKIMNVEEMIRQSLQKPIAALPLAEQVKSGMKVVIVGDDLTRPTPRAIIFPVILDELNRCGVPDKDITVLIGLGTHRYMKEEEIRQSFGEEVVERVTILNHEWKNAGNFARLGYTPKGTPIEVNKIAVDADFLMAIGNIVPHCYAGYGGGGKAVQPGICSWETTGRTHIMPVEQDLYLQIAGEVENAVRQEIETVAEMAGLRFIVNVVLNDEGEIVHVVAGDPVQAHRAGVRFAQGVYERPIPSLADIVVVSAFPADIDYWQGIKPLSYAQKGLKKGGTSILVAPFEEGISATHSALFRDHATRSYRELKKKVEEGTFDDLVCAATLLLHAKVMEHSREVICVSKGLSIENKEILGFRHASTIEEALDMAFKTQGREARVGIINCGGDILPRLTAP